MLTAYVIDLFFTPENSDDNIIKCLRLVAWIAKICIIIHI